MKHPMLEEAGTGDRIIRLTEAGKRLKILDKPASLPSLMRWTTVGRYGVVLEAFKIGKAWFTSERRLQRFLDQVAARQEGRKRQIA